VRNNRDNFRPATKELLAKRAGYLCSNPDCRRLTVGAAMGHEGLVGRQSGIEPGYPSGTAAVISTLAEPFHVSGMAAAVEAFSEFIIIAPPGTSKTTTVLQRSYRAGARLPSSSRSVIGPPQSESLLASLVRRPAFQGIREQHLVLLAHRGDWFSRWTAGTTSARRAD
jgi:hypothetical protein